MAKRKKKATPDESPSRDVVTNNTDRGSYLYWKQQIDASKSASKDYWDAVDEAYREFMCHYSYEGTPKAPIKAPEARYPIYWSSVRAVQPALYSRTPTPVAKVMLDDLEDSLADLASLCYERLAKYLMNQTSFDRSIYSTRDDFIHGSKATNRVYFEAETETSEQARKVYVFQIPDPSWVPPAPPPEQTPPQTPDQAAEAGQILPEPSEAMGENAGATQPPAPAPEEATEQQAPLIWVDEQGNPVQFQGQPFQDEFGTYLEATDEELTSENICLVPVSYRDIVHTAYARTEDEIDFRAYRLKYTRKQAEKRFGADIAAVLSYTDKPMPKDAPHHSAIRAELPEGYASIWEIWDGEDKKIRCIADAGYEGFLSESDDIYGLPGFYPSPPFIIGNVGQNDLYPTPDYIQLRPFVLQLHSLARRFKRQVASSRCRGVYDAAVNELEALNTLLDEGDFIGVNSFATLVEKGGLENIVQFFPTDQIINTLQVMAEVIKQYKETFTEMWGIPDIYMSATDPNETLGAQQLKGKYFAIRFSSVQREFQRFIRDDIELMGDLALCCFSRAKLANIMGENLMSEEDKELFPRALALLRDFEHRPIRIDIETDSTIQMNEEADMEQRDKLGNTVITGITNAIQAANGDPNVMKVTFETLLYIVRGLRNGKVIEEPLTKALSDIENAPPPPTPPDYELMKLQNEKERNDNEFAIRQAEVANERLKIMLEARPDQPDPAAMAKVQVEAGKSQIAMAELAVEQQWQALEQQSQLLKAKAEQLQTQIDAFRARASAAEAASEERRLAIVEPVQAAAALISAKAAARNRVQ